MKFQPGFEDYFLSPITGRILESGLPSLELNYIWIGSRSKRPIQSPAIIDLRLDLAKLRFRLNDTKFILQSAHDGFNKAQALDELETGMLKQTEGVISIAIPGTDYMLPVLPKNNIWIGDNSNKPVPNQRIGNINLPPFITTDVALNLGIYNLYTGGTINVSDFTNDPGPVASTILRIKQSNLPNINKGKMWIGVVNSTQPTITIDTTPPYFHVTAGNLNWDSLGASDDSHAVPTEIGLNKNELFVGNSDNSGQITTTVILDIANMANLTQNKFWVGNSSNRPVESDTLPESGLPNLTYKNIWVGNMSDRPTAQIILYIDNMANLSKGKLWTGDDDNRPIEIETITIDNLPDLTSGNIWRGDSSNRPEESADLSNLENTVSDLQTQVDNLQTQVDGIQTQVDGLETDIAAINTEIAAIQVEIVAIQAELVVIAGEIVALQAQVTTLEAAVVILQGQVVTLFAQIAALDAYVKNITLDTFIVGGPPDATTGVIHTARGPTCLLTNIPAGGDVDFGNYRIFNLATFNPMDWFDMEVKQQDGINFLFLWNFFGGGTR